MSFDSVKKTPRDLRSMPLQVPTKRCSISAYRVQFRQNHFSKKIIGVMPELKTLTEKPLRIVIANAHALFRAGLRRLLENSGAGIEVVGEAGGGRDAIRQVLKLRPHILVLDLVLPELDGLEVLRQLQTIRRVRKVLLVKQIDQDKLAKAAALGVTSVLLKESSAEALLECIRRLPDPNVGPSGVISAGFGTSRLSISPRELREQRFRITKREMEVLEALVEGCINSEIAKRLLISTETVKHHLTNLFNKTGASNRLELVLFATEKGLVHRPHFGIGLTAVAWPAKRSA